MDDPNSSRYDDILPPGKLRWQWKNKHLKMYLLLKMVIFHCHVSFQEGVYIICWCGGYPPRHWTFSSACGRLPTATLHTSCPIQAGVVCHRRLELDVSPTSMDTKRNRWDQTTQKGGGKKNLMVKLSDFCCRSRAKFWRSCPKMDVLQIKHLQFFSLSKENSSNFVVFSGVLKAWETCKGRNYKAQESVVEPWKPTY